MNEVEFARLYVVVEGRVQGVGYRNFVQIWADSLDLTGWARNRFDGTVEVTAEGPRPILEKLLKALQVGPRAARVANISAEWQPARGGFTGFHLRPTE
jgi:acylphosphatase